MNLSNASLRNYCLKLCFLAGTAWSRYLGTGSGQWVQKVTQFLGKCIRNFWVTLLEADERRGVGAQQPSS